MTPITVDSNELFSAAETLRAGAIEAADIGTALRSCTDCAMPGELRHVIDQLIAAADRALDTSALQLSVWANDLSNRAHIALTDGLTASLITNGYSAAPTAGLYPATAVVGGDWGAWNPAADEARYTTTTAVGGDWATWDPAADEARYMTAANVGGDWATWSLGNADVGISRTTATVGGAVDISNNPVLLLADAVDRKNQSIRSDLNLIFSNPNATAGELAVAHRVLDSDAYNTSYSLAPSRRALEDQFGPLTDADIKSISPYTLPNPYTNILFPTL